MTRNENASLTEQALLQRARKGNVEAFGILYERYMEEIHRYIFFRMPNRFEAEDLTEKVFLLAWQALKGASAPIKNFRAWLYRIAHNVTVDFYRSRRPVENLDSDQWHSGDPSLDHQAQHKITIHKLINAIRSLDVKMQQVIICRFINGLSHAQTAEVLKIKEGHVRVLQYRALKLLREIMEDDK